jgi:hypothetical protein
MNPNQTLLNSSTTAFNFNANAQLLKIAVSTLIVSLALTINPHLTQAQSNSSAISNPTTYLTGKIARNLFTPTLIDKSLEDNTDTETSAARDRSMELLKSGYEFEKAENEELALVSYYTAMKVDPTNGYSYLMAGRMLGNTETGIDCLKAAIELFKAQHNLDGYQLATELLATFSASN